MLECEYVCVCFFFLLFLTSGNSEQIWIFWQTSKKKKKNETKRSGSTIYINKFSYLSQVLIWPEKSGMWCSWGVVKWSVVNCRYMWENSIWLVLAGVEVRIELNWNWIVLFPWDIWVHTHTYKPKKKRHEKNKNNFKEIKICPST